MNKKKLRNVGLLIFVVSIVGGAIGTVLGIYWSFQGLAAAESGGLGPISDGLGFGLVSALVGILGALVGGGVLAYSGLKRNTQ